MRVAVAASWIAALAVPTTALAAEPVLVAPVVAAGEMNEAVVERFAARLDEVVDKSEVETLDVPAELLDRVRDCKDAGCRAEALEAAGATFLLVPEVALTNEDFHLRLRLYGARGSEVAVLEDTCELCGLAEAVDVMGELGARIGRKVEVATRASMVSVVTDPPGARVFLDGALVGTTPVELPVEPGSPELSLELDGYIGVVRSLDVAPGEAKTLEIGLQVVPDSSGDDRDGDGGDGRALAGAGWGVLAVGVAAAAGGGVLIGLDEQPIRSDCSGPNIDVEGNCRYRYATLEGGIGLAAGGLALVATGVALLVVAKKRSKAPKDSQVGRIQPTIGGFGVRF